MFDRPKHCFGTKVFYQQTMDFVQKQMFLDKNPSFAPGFKEDIFVRKIYVKFVPTTSVQQRFYFLSSHLSE
jgi:hypothetical protein